MVLRDVKDTWAISDERMGTKKKRENKVSHRKKEIQYKEQKFTIGRHEMNNCFFVVQRKREKREKAGKLSYK